MAAPNRAKITRLFFIDTMMRPVAHMCNWENASRQLAWDVIVRVSFDFVAALLGDAATPLG